MSNLIIAEKLPGHSLAHASFYGIGASKFPLKFERDARVYFRRVGENSALRCYCSRGIM
jgi:hypothetical protein